MSDPKNTQPIQPPPSKTTGVPLKKETVRITLRARPGAGLTQPREVTAPIPPSAATAQVNLPVPAAPVPSPVAPRPPGASPLPPPPAGISNRPPGGAPLPPSGGMANKATSPIQLPSAPLPPPAARPTTSPVVVARAATATAPVSLVNTAPVVLPSSPVGPPASRSTAYVKLDPATAPVAPMAPPPSAPRPGAPPSPAMGAPRAPGAPPRPGAPAAPRPPGAPPAPAGGPPPPGAPKPAGIAPIAPTVALNKAPAAPAAPRPPGAPPAPGLAPAPAGAAPRPPGAKIEAGAATVPLAKSPVAPAPKAPGTGTAPVARVGGPTQSLPKATVQLQKTGPGAAAGGAGAPAPVRRPAPAVEDNAPLYEEKDPEAGLVPLSMFCCAMAVGLFLLSVFGSDKFFVANPGETSAFKVPAVDPPKWEQSLGNGKYESNFNAELKKITSIYE